MHEYSNMHMNAIHEYSNMHMNAMHEYSNMHINKPDNKLSGFSMIANYV